MVCRLSCLWKSVTPRLAGMPPSSEESVVVSSHVMTLPYGQTGITWRQRRHEGELVCVDSVKVGGFSEFTSSSPSGPLAGVSLVQQLRPHWLVADASHSPSRASSGLGPAENGLINVVHWLRGVC